MAESFALCDASQSIQSINQLVLFAMAKRNKQRAFALAIQSSDHLIAEKYYDYAALILQRYLSIHPPHARVLRRLGRVRMYQGRPHDAAPLLALALQVETALPSAA